VVENAATSCADAVEAVDRSRRRPRAWRGPSGVRRWIAGREEGGTATQQRRVRQRQWQQRRWSRCHSGDRSARVPTAGTDNQTEASLAPPDTDNSGSRAGVQGGNCLHRPWDFEVW